MGRFEEQQGDANASSFRPSLTTPELVTSDDRKSTLDSLKGSQTNDSVLVRQGTLPEIGIDIAQGDSVNRKAATQTNGQVHLNDILPSMDLQMVRSEQKAGRQFKYEMYEKSSGTSSDVHTTLTAKDRENSIMYKMETGQVDGSKIFKNAAELMSKTDAGGISKTSSHHHGPGGSHDHSPRQQVPGDVSPQGEQTGPAGEQTRPQGEQTRPGQEQTRPGQEQTRPGGDQSPPPYRSERLQMNPDGSASVPVKPGDTLWGIARETLRHGQPPGHQPTDREIANAVNRIARENPQIRNRDVIVPGRDTVKIPKDLIKEIPTQTEPQDGPRIQVENRGASPEFAERMQREADALPPGVRRLLEANGTKIVVGDRVSGVYPELENVRPRGWPPGSTWDNADGLYSPSDKTAVVTERRVDNGRTVSNDRAEGVFKHELGHAVDHAMGNFSQSEEFRQAYERDVANLTDEQKQQLQYLLQPGDAGKSEAFAEVFGALNGSSANPAQTQEVLRQFPNVAALMKRKFDAM